MKKQLLKAIIPALALFVSVGATSAFAENAKVNVKVKGEGELTSTTSGKDTQTATSFNGTLFVKGTEDIADGLKAEAYLEFDFKNYTGRATSLDEAHITVKGSNWYLSADTDSTQGGDHDYVYYNDTIWGGTYGDNRASIASFIGGYSFGGQLIELGYGSQHDTNVLTLINPRISGKLGDLSYIVAAESLTVTTADGKTPTSTQSHEVVSINGAAPSTKSSYDTLTTKETGIGASITYKFGDFLPQIGYSSLSTTNITGATNTETKTDITHTNVGFDYTINEGSGISVSTEAISNTVGTAKALTGTSIGVGYASTWGKRVNWGVEYYALSKDVGDKSISMIWINYSLGGNIL